MATEPDPGHVDPVSGLAPTPPGAPQPDEPDSTGTPPADAIRRGYEEDGYDTKSVISVPILVIAFFVLAFTSVTIMFAYFRHTPVDPMAHPQAVKRNTDRSLNERLGATPERGRPEPLQILDNRVDPRALTRPPVPGVNPPLLHPEDIRPSPEKTPELYRVGWVNEGKVARVPLDDARTMALTALKDKLLKARDGATKPRASYQIPSGANAGRGKPPMTHRIQKTDKKPMDKKPDDKKEGKG